mmetsp:Transcript_13127/g.18139  ORF Transcript_13127/g.18139 Transcript_13127/m.18139 type:complete len:306 (-) Transcript_13127:220-1137(-)|eukprot:CAMPEP_0184484346 /NCGR_PEP_ID=MMETSP0113_2-20130426/6070_1 /TAXON_ID=91329 /ORGANISM="Norrisiella sphaerica, Strain BC52" /LENGTH=305 /DNA_ID=CAMNT_0026865303 /DNA_START=130 /DNA_END=1047 /DNA_ORIENTATION=-
MQAQQRLEAMQQLMLRQQGEKIVEFKAGILKKNGTTVTADPRRGTVTLLESAADGMTRIQWRTRPGGNLVTDLVVIPNDATVEKVPECKTGRVILVRMRSSQKMLFFWMQEPKDEKDQEIVDKMKNAFASSRGQGAGMGAGAGMGGAGSMEQAIQQFLMQSRGGSGGAQAQQAAAANQMAVEQMRQMQATSITNIISQSSEILEALDEKERARLFEFLPDGQKDAKGFEAAITSPQLQQGANRLDRVLNSAQYGNLATSFGLQNLGEIGSKAFIDAIKLKFPKEEEKKDEAKEENKEEDNKMETE